MQSLKIKIGLGCPFPLTRFWLYGCLLEAGVEEYHSAMYLRAGSRGSFHQPIGLSNQGQSGEVPGSPTIHPHSDTASPSVRQETTHLSLQLWEPSKQCYRNSMEEAAAIKFCLRQIT